MAIQTHAPAHVIVIGNEKGGSGKSTVAMHTAVGLLRLGFRVATIDLDTRQQTLTHYFKNRQRFADGYDADLPQPQHHAFQPSKYDARSVASNDEAWRLGEMIGSLRMAADFIIMDCPGMDNFLAREAHSYADTLITPMNDSFVDFILLGEMDAKTKRVLDPSLYSDMVAEQRRRRTLRDGGSIDWIVLRNRLSHLKARNKQDMEDAITALSSRVDFRAADGLSERVVYRELFLHGLTMFDTIEDDIADVPLSPSHIAARNEVQQLLDALNLPAIWQRTAPAIANDMGPRRGSRAA